MSEPSTPPPAKTEAPKSGSWFSQGQERRRGYGTLRSDNYGVGRGAVTEDGRRDTSTKPRKRARMGTFPGTAKLEPSPGARGLMSHRRADARSALRAEAGSCGETSHDPPGCERGRRGCRSESGADPRGLTTEKRSSMEEGTVLEESRRRATFLKGSVEEARHRAEAGDREVGVEAAAGTEGRIGETRRSNQRRLRTEEERPA